MRRQPVPSPAGRLGQPSVRRRPIVTEQTAVESAVVDGRDQGVDGQALQFGSVDERAPASNSRAIGRRGVSGSNRASMKGRYANRLARRKLDAEHQVGAGGEERLAAQGPRRRDPASGIGHSVGDRFVHQHRKKIGVDLRDGRLARDDGTS